MIVITGKVKQAQWDVYQESNAMCKELGRPDMYDLKNATLDIGTQVEQFKRNVETDKAKQFKKDNGREPNEGELALLEVVSKYGTQYPMKLNGQPVIIRVNGSVSKYPLPPETASAISAGARLAPCLVSQKISSRKKKIAGL